MFDLLFDLIVLKIMTFFKIIEVKIEKIRRDKEFERTLKLFKKLGVKVSFSDEKQQFKAMDSTGQYIAYAKSSVDALFRLMAICPELGRSLDDN